MKREPIRWRGHSTSIGGVSYTDWARVVVTIDGRQYNAQMRVIVDEYGRESVQYDLPMGNRMALRLYRAAMEQEQEASNGYVP